MSKFIESAESRETSVELMNAILTIANGNEDIATKIWEDGSHVEEIKSELNKKGLNPNSLTWGSAGTGW